MLDRLVTNMNAQLQLCVLCFLPIAAITNALQSGKTNREENRECEGKSASNSVSHHLPCSAVRFCCVEQIMYPFCVSVPSPYNEDKY